MLRVRAADELVADALWSLGALAVREADGHLDAAFASGEDEEAAARALASHHPVEVLDDDGSWRGAWRQWAAPTTVGGVAVRPAWIDGPGIAIEPGEAFGIGSHPTTRLAGDALARHVREGDAVLDVGTGTGVLAMVAVALGARVVRAVDLDEHAVEVARANVERNGLAGSVVVDATPIDAIEPTFEVVVANLGGLLQPLALVPALAGRTSRVLIVSGLLDPDEGAPPLAPLDDALSAHGFLPAGTWAASGWLARAWCSG